MSSLNTQKSLNLQDEARVIGFATLANKSLPRLAEKELRLVQQIISVRGAGRYTLRKLFADLWDPILSKRSIGRRFKRSVLEGLIVGIELRERNSSKSWTYEVLPPHVTVNDDLARRTA